MSDEQKLVLARRAVEHPETLTPEEVQSLALDWMELNGEQIKPTPKLNTA